MIRKQPLMYPFQRKHIRNLSNYRPKAFTSAVMKCFEKLVLAHITSLLPLSLNQHQFACRANRSTEDAIDTTLHS